jgi:hypothetical protein
MSLNFERRLKRGKVNEAASEREALESELSFDHFEEASASRGQVRLTSRACCAASSLLLPRTCESCGRSQSGTVQRHAGMRQVYVLQVIPAKSHVRLTCVEMQKWPPPRQVRRTLWRMNEKAPQMLWQGKHML